MSDSTDNAAVLSEAYAAITELVSPLDPFDFSRPTGCAGWTINALLFHILLDAQRCLITLADPVDSAADTDAVTYWRAYESAQGDDERKREAHAAFVRKSAEAYLRPSGLVEQWTDTCRAAAAAARRADPAARVATQDHVLTVRDFLATLVVEAALHHLDLVVALPDGLPPPASALRITRRTLEGLLGQPAPGWADVALARGLTGRRDLSHDERAELGEAVERLPLIR